MRNRCRQLSEARQQMAEQFQSLSAEVLKTNSQQLAQQQNERLTHLLKPFDQRLQAFGEQVRRSYDTEVRERVSLKEELKRLAEQGERMTREADGRPRPSKAKPKPVVIGVRLFLSGYSNNPVYEGKNTAFKSPNTMRIGAVSSPMW